MGGRRPNRGRAPLSAPVAPSLSRIDQVAVHLHTHVPAQTPGCFNVIAKLALGIEMIALEQAEELHDPAEARAHIVDAVVAIVELLDGGGEQHCRVCGCTNDAACEGGCHWVALDLCSECKPA